MTRTRTSAFQEVEVLRRWTRLLVAACAVATLLASPAGALVIDDFETGAFNLTTTLLVGETDVQSGLPPANVLGGQREVTVRGGGTSTATAELVLTAGPDSIMLSKPSLRSGSFDLGWSLDPGGVDLTQGGSNDRFLIGISAVDDIFNVIMSVSDTGVVGVTPHPSVQANAAGPITLLFSDFAGVDFTEIDRIEISIPSRNFTMVHISEVLAVPEPGTGLLVMAGMLGLSSWRRRRV